MAEKVYTTKEVAEHLRVKPITILRWLNAGKIKGVKMSNEWRILDSELQEYLDGLKAKRNGKQ